jgi:predicted membrane protein
MIAIFGTSIGPFIIWMIFYDRWEYLNIQSLYSVRFILKKWHFYQAVILNTFLLTFYELCGFFLKYYVNPTMTEYTHQLKKKKLIQQDEFWQHNLIKIVKKKSSKVRNEVKNRKNQKRKPTTQEELHSAKLVRTVTHGYQ